MYGLLLASICDALKGKFGEKIWQDIRQRAGIPHHSFIAHKTYSETVIPRLTKAAHDVTSTPTSELINMYGESFFGFVCQFGYDRILHVLGRHVRDFLNGLDNLHEYLRFSYPKMKPPSFFCENETRSGLTLHYRSKRKGYLHYVMGQIHVIGLQLYHTPIEIEIISEEETLDMTHVIMQLHFENTAFSDEDCNNTHNLDSLRMSSETFFDVFPFHLVFNRAMIIRNTGSGLAVVMSDLIGQAIDEMFTLSRPLVEFTLENVLMHTNNVFELTSVDPIRRAKSQPEVVEGSDTATEFTAEDDDPDDGSKRMKLKGQMMLMSDWEAVIFLGTPVLENLDRMFETGLYINDLSMHDSSRDLVLAGTQQSAELKLALDQEQQKSKKLEESMCRLDIEMKHTDQLLYQMIPRQVAERLKKGEPAVSTCELCDQVTILFSDVVGFTRICSQITPMAVVSMLNAMYTKFDRLSEKHRVYKVETIGDAYMVVSGAPTSTTYHALYICDMAFDMLDSMADLTDPSTGKWMQIRIGIHSGTVVAGVVGHKMPRYCLFGETVNTASLMETNGEAMKIHISWATKKHLEKYNYTLIERGTLDVKGRGLQTTYWLVGKPMDSDGQARLPVNRTEYLSEVYDNGQRSLPFETKRRRNRTLARDSLEKQSPDPISEMNKKSQRSSKSVSRGSDVSTTKTLHIGPLAGNQDKRSETKLRNHTLSRDLSEKKSPDPTSEMNKKSQRSSESVGHGLDAITTKTLHIGSLASNQEKQSETKLRNRTLARDSSEKKSPDPTSEMNKKPQRSSESVSRGLDAITTKSLHIGSLASNQEKQSETKLRNRTLARDSSKSPDPTSEMNKKSRRSSEGLGLEVITAKTLHIGPLTSNQDKLSDPTSLQRSLRHGSGIVSVQNTSSKQSSGKTKSPSPLGPETVGGCPFSFTPP